MSKIETSPFSCDGCGSAKGETNHWRVLIIVSSSAIKCLGIYEWNESVAKDPEARHACGHNCTQKLVEQYLHHGRFYDKRGSAVSA